MSIHLSRSCALKRQRGPLALQLNAVHSKHKRFIVLVLYFKVIWSQQIARRLVVSRLTNEFGPVDQPNSTAADFSRLIRRFGASPHQHTSRAFKYRRVCGEGTYTGVVCARDDAIHMACIGRCSSGDSGSTTGQWEEARSPSNPSCHAIESHSYISRALELSRPPVDACARS
jgi:hypothetical protein